MRVVFSRYVRLVIHFRFCIIPAKEVKAKSEKRTKGGKNQCRPKRQRSTVTGLSRHLSTQNPTQTDDMASMAQVGEQQPVSEVEKVNQPQEPVKVEGDNQEVNMNMQELFDRELELILKKIFLFLDPKSLKNSKLTCSQWRDFIDKNIWKSESASVKNQLHHKLISGWKWEEPVRITNKEFPTEVDRLVCDSEVIVCSLWSFTAIILSKGSLQSSC